MSFDTSVMNRDVKLWYLASDFDILFLVLFSPPTRCKIVNVKQKYNVYYVASMSVWTTISLYAFDNATSKIKTAGQCYLVGDVSFELIVGECPDIIWDNQLRYNTISAILEYIEKIRYNLHLFWYNVAHLAYIIARFLFFKGKRDTMEKVSRLNKRITFRKLFRQLLSALHHSITKNAIDIDDTNARYTPHSPMCWCDV